MKQFRADETEQMAEILRNDGVISVPTDTVYGVCARMDHEKAQERLREVKQRPADKAFPIMCASRAQIGTVAVVDERAGKLIDGLMPGPVTLILRKREDVPAFVNGGMDTLAVRMAPSEAVRRLIEAVGVPLYMTSANRSGEKTGTCLDEIELACPLLDGMMEGETLLGAASTIIDCTQPEIKILRAGPAGMDDIHRVLEEDGREAVQ
ncbi:MAG: threonylcarbamoyl-AMP synthase [Solobacterium sp.]|nr:threonylcarbamoyl-AMP synthase [Solobacterium sp.]